MLHHSTPLTQISIVSVIIFAEKMDIAFASFFMREQKLDKTEVAPDWNIKAWGVAVGGSKALY